MINLEEILYKEIGGEEITYKEDILEAMKKACGIAIDLCVVNAEVYKKTQI